MEEIQLAYFKKNINSIIASVCHSDKSVLITDKDKLLVRIVPISSSINNSWLGCMSNSGRIVDDVVSPAEDSDVWEVLSE
jgi:hypothetical protein